MKKNSLRYFPADMLVLLGLPYILIAFIAGAMLPMMNEPWLAVESALLVASFGAGLLFWAKLPLYQAGIYCSFGPGAIPEERRGFYYWGLGLAAAGCALAAMLIPLC